MLDQAIDTDDLVGIDVGIIRGAAVAATG